MTLSKEVTETLQLAMEYTLEKGYEYITPETILYSLCENDTFVEAFEECDGDIGTLLEELSEYLEDNLEKVGKDKVGTENIPLSFDANMVINLASQSAYNSGKKEVKVSHLVNAFFLLKESFALYYIMKQDVDKAELLRELAELEEESAESEEGLNGTRRGSGKKRIEGSLDDEDVEDEGDEIDDDEEYIIDGDDAETDGDEIEGDDIEDDEEPDGGNGHGHPLKKKASHVKGWHLYAPCLNDTADEANPLIGRENEIERTIQILCRKDKNNPLHIGEPGVGKTAIMYGLVRLINEGRVPEPLKGSRVYALDMAGMLAGTQYRGDFEKRFKQVLGNIEKEERPIVYLDEIHNILGAGAVGEGSFDAANMLKSYLSGGHVRFVGATTFEEYKKYFEKSKSLVRRFQNVEIKEPTEDETVKILEGLKDKYEKFHGVKYADGVLEYAVAQSAKHINERFLPDKAIDLIDEAGAYRKLHLLPKKDKVSDEKSDTPNKSAGIEEWQRTVDKDVINTVLTKICRVPIETVETDDLAGLATLEYRLKTRIFGQDEAIAQVVNAVKFSKAGLLEENKPLASLLFVGPTGVGKTEVAKSLAEELGVKLLRFDMSEYEEKHAVAKLIGAPAGYVGYDEGGQLTEAIRKNPSSVLLLDEIEKAHADIYNILLQVMDYATLTDNQGRKADFRNVVVIMTSNAGANRLGKTSIGFSSESLNESVITEEVKKTFQPEFRNRLNRIVVFNSMDDDMATLVVEKKLKELSDMLKAKNITLLADKEAKDLIRKRGISQEFGAREIDRIIRNEVKPLFVDEILFGKLKSGGTIRLVVKEEKIAFCMEKG